MKKTILIDVDEVICQNHLFPWINEYLKKIGRPTYKSVEEITSIRSQFFVFPDEEDRNKFFDYYVHLDSYKNIPPVEGAVEAVKKLHEIHDVYLLTACIHSYTPRVREFSREFADKFHWILDNFPFFPPDKIIMSNKKHLFKADVIIDDRIGFLDGDYPTKILFTARHNKTMTKEELDKIGAVRANNWAEVLRILKN